MFNNKVSKGLQVSLLALSVVGGLSGAAMAESDGIVGDAAAQLAAQSDRFQATTATLDVVPAKMAGGCPQSFAFNVRLGAQSPGMLSYRFVTDDGRQSQVFQAKTEAGEDGLFVARASHELALAKDDGNGPTFVIFDEPERVKPLREPDFFERLFGIDPNEDEDQARAQAMRDMAFMVQVVAPNEVDSAFDSHSVTCERQREAWVLPVAEEQRDDRDRPGRDRPGRDRPGRDDSSTDGGGRGDRGRDGGTPGAL